MYRSLRWIYYGQRQRKVALGLAFGSSIALGTGAHHFQRPFLAEGGSVFDAGSWGSKSTVISAGDSNNKHAGAPSKDLHSTSKGAQTPPPQTKGHSTSVAGGDSHDAAESAWKDATDRVAAVCDSFTGWDFAGLRTKIHDAVMPYWIRMLPGYIDKLQDELSGAPWSLSWEIWEDAHDPEINPEIVWDARVRMSKDLCQDEQDFLQRRRKHTTKALAQYLGVSESEIHADDVPIIAMCGSGGGLRALVAGASSSLCAQEDGLLDCVTYTAGVSGSCWLQTLYNSSIGKHSHANVIEHLKRRIGVHIAYPPAALGLLSQAPTNKFLLSGFVEKLRGVPDADFGLTDVYGLLLAARLLVPKGELRVSDSDLKLSNQRYFVQTGEVPLPIYTAVRHEVPAELKGHVSPSMSAWHTTKHYDWFQWFEWTPFEFFCEELECGIPTWAVGRSWSGGNTVWRENGLALPELRVPLMMGIWGSAFCATLSHYYKEIRPLLRAAGLNKLDNVLSGQDEELTKVHPIDPAVIPNFALGLRGQLPDTTPESIHESNHLQLMDAGMSNNLPIYPLLRPGRDVDVVIAFDASADVRADNWVKVVDGYVRQRGIKGWPMGAGWPPKAEDKKEAAELIGDVQAANSGKMDEVLEEAHYLKPDRDDLGYCTVWVGTTQEREYMDESPSRRLKSAEDEWHLTAPGAGISLIYFPFLANDKVSGVDPLQSDFMSTWNFIYTPDEIDKVVALARANFEEGKEQTRRTIRAVWERKKSLRLQREKEEKAFWKKCSVTRSEHQGQWNHLSVM